MAYLLYKIQSFLHFPWLFALFSFIPLNVRSFRNYVECAKSDLWRTFFKPLLAGEKNVIKLDKHYNNNRKRISKQNQALREFSEI